MKHKHHIVPRHMGGSDDPSNLLHLTIEEHAEEHRLLWEKHGKKDDYVAWKALSGQLSKLDILQELCSLGGTNSAIKRRERGDPIGWQVQDKESRINMASRGGRKSGELSLGRKWWISIDGKYAASHDKPEGNWKQSNSPNNVGKVTKNTKWWNNGTNHKRSSTCPGNEWVEGRINRGNLGGIRIKQK